MDNKLHNIIVPWDFSPSSNFALQHAIQIAKVRNLNILLLHFESNTAKSYSAQAKLTQIASEAQVQSGVTIVASIHPGTVQKSLKAEALKPENELIVMKTDGIKGLQKYIGSKAIKMIRGIQIPTIVVQQMPSLNPFHRIIFSIDYRPENKELVSAFFHQIHQFYANSKIFLIKPHFSDTLFKKNISNNLNFIKKMLENKGIDFDVIELEGKKNSADEVNDIAHSIESDMIIVQLEKQLNLTKFLFGVKEVRIIANPYKIPVLCINPKKAGIYQSFN